VEETGAAFQRRYRIEQLLEVSCPKCGARPQDWCDRTDGELSQRGRELLRAGTPPSHQERMWARQGHDERELPVLLARQRPGWDETVTQAGKPRRRVARRGVADPACIPGYPRRYQADRPCPECGHVVLSDVAMLDPATIGYMCRRGHKWLVRMPRARKAAA
jgi:endogenous inhibitor of DNA gyrase (YacG/DUF329 family)